ncbi:ABC transporter permease [Streptacidiphilus pinicola]|uniref:ABC transporter permease n=1 Tax=Streptacidiphilus pinicola TaxID=2219663 RepID=A0A2X0KDJ1_9ACTN|nr:ABC transporter permease [Streptacidiphilus pinicola]RAG85249.1 ABC transporter permease [Streptacidiphilus pinicola]
MFGLVLRRARGRLPLAIAMLLTVLISTTVLTCLTAFGRSVGDAGVRRALQGPGHDRTTVLVEGTEGADQRPAEDAAVAAFGHTLFGRFPVAVDAVSHSRSYGLPGPSSTGGSDPDLTRLAALGRDHVQLLSGRWPAAAHGPGTGVEAAVPRAELARLRLDAHALPARVTLADRYGGGPTTVTVTGVYRALDATAPYWQLDPFGGREVQLNGFAGYGPMLVDDTVFTTRALPEDGRSWLLSPDLSTIRQPEADALRARVDPASSALEHADPFTVQTQLDAELDDVRAGAQASASDQLIGSLQLALLAAVALLLVVQLQGARQAPEDALLAARGATRRRVALLTALQALLLTLPAAVLAPLLTPVLLRLLAHGYGPLRQVPLDTSLNWRSWLVAGLCALGCAVLAAAPALLRGATDLLARAGQRHAVVGGVARSGADLALIALAVLAYRELGHSSADAGNGLGVDPVAVAAPSLALCAGTVVVLRLLPYAARLGGLLAARGRGLSAALVGWQLARRPGRTTGPTLLLVLAVATGVLALGQHSSWSASQSDQASFATADGLRIWGSTLPALGQGGRFGTLPGGDRIIPVARTQASLPDGSQSELLAVDAAGVAARVPIRADLLGGQSTARLFGPLVAAAPPHGAAGGVPLPGRPQRLDLRVTTRLTGFTAVAAPDGGAATASQQAGPTLQLQLRDRFGAVHLVETPTVPLSGATTLAVNLSGPAGTPLGAPAWPLTLAGVQVQVQPLPGVALSGRLTVQGIATAATADGPATTVAAPAGTSWSAYTPPAQSADASSQATTVVDGAGVLAFDYRTNQNILDAAITPASSGAGPAPTDNLPALATRDYLSAVAAKVGDVVPFPVGDATVRLRITGVLNAMPTAGSKAVVVDLSSLTRQLAALDATCPEPTEWWLPAAAPDDPVPARAAAALRALPGTQDVQLRGEVAAQLTDDPLGAGPQVTLLVLAVVAAVLAAIGFGAATAAAASERARENAVLRALGCPPRRLARTAAAEPAVLIVLGAAVGLAVGTLIVHLVVPLVVLTPTAQQPVPPVQVTLPLGRTFALVGAIVVVPVLTAFLSGRRSTTARPRPLEEL